jgi:hypothetical protein
VSALLPRTTLSFRVEPCLARTSDAKNRMTPRGYRVMWLPLTTAFVPPPPPPPPRRVEEGSGPPPPRSRPKPISWPRRLLTPDCELHGPLEPSCEEIAEDVAAELVGILAPTRHADIAAVILASSRTSCRRRRPRPRPRSRRRPRR